MKKISVGDPGPDWSEERDTKKERATLILDGLSIEQLLFLAEFSRDYVAGRRVFCLIARSIVAVGVIAGALAAILTAVHTVYGWKL